MTDRELRSWQVFEVRNPFPADLLDVHMATLASIVVNLTRGENSQPVSAERFLVIRRGADPAPGEEAKPEMSEAARMALAAGLR